MGVMLLVAYLVIAMLEPVASSMSASDAFLSAPQPFKASPVALLSEADKLNALVEGMTTYGLSVAAEASPWWYYALRLLAVASSFFGSASLLGVCSISFPELRRVFLPLESAKRPVEPTRAVGRFVTIAAALPLAWMAAFVGVNAQVAELEGTEEYTWAEKTARDQVGFIAAYIDGKYYDLEAVQELMEQGGISYEAITAEMKETLTSVVQETCDKQIENVDDYLELVLQLDGRL